MKQKLVVIPTHHADVVEGMVNDFYGSKGWVREDHHYLLEEGPYTFFTFNFDHPSDVETLKFCVSKINEIMSDVIEADYLWS